MLPGGCNGLGLDVEAQHPPLRADEAAEEGRVAAVAAGGVDAQGGMGQVGRKIVLYQAHCRQVGGAAAAEPSALGDEAEFFPEQPLALVGRQRRSEDRGGLPVIAAEAAQDLFQ